MRRPRLAPRDTGAFLLSYAGRRPFLSVIDVDAAEELRVRTNFDRLGYALDRVLPRDGFFAFAPNVSSALLPADFATEAVVIDEVGWPAPAVAADRVWIRPYTNKEEAREVDGRGEVRRTVTCPAGWAVRGELADAFVVDRQGTGAALWRPGHDPEPLPSPRASIVKVLPPDRVIVASSDGIREYDSRGALHRRVDFDLPEWKSPCAGVSHDGRFVAIDAIHHIDVISTGATHRLRYCDLELGTCTTVEGLYEGFCYPPVFSRSDRHVFLGVPFENCVLAFDVESFVLVDIAPRGVRTKSMPLFDLASLPAAVQRPERRR